jgi:hypothetical protein
VERIRPQRKVYYLSINGRINGTGNVASVDSNPTPMGHSPGFLKTPGEKGYDDGKLQYNDRRLLGP